MMCSLNLGLVTRREDVKYVASLKSKKSALHLNFSTKYFAELTAKAVLTVPFRCIQILLFKRFQYNSFLLYLPMDTKFVDTSPNRLS